MTSQAAFNAEEWEVLTNASFLTGMLVIGADRHRSFLETIALARAYETARGDQPGNELLHAILLTPPALDPATAPRTPADLRREVPPLLRRAVAIMERVGSEEELIAYERFVLSLADTVARAHREGGFLELGGEEVSDNEQAVLDEITAIFNAPHPTPMPSRGGTSRSSACCRSGS